MENELSAINFKGWVARAISKENTPETIPQWGLSQLQPENVESLLSDLSDVKEDLRNSVSLIDGLLLEDPDTDKLEKAFVDVEIGVAHAVHHWRRALTCLQAEGLWMEDDFFDRHSL